MKIIQIDKKDWNGGLKKSKDRFRLIGPMKDKGKDTSRFRVLEVGENPDLDIHVTTLSPKSVTFPPSEVILEYTTDVSKEDCNITRAPEKSYVPQAVIGIRPFDAAAMLILQKNFDTPEYRDPYWCDAYDASTFIGLAINRPDQYDFSTSTGTGPFDTSGLDVLLVDAGDRFLAQVVTDKGNDWLVTAGFQEEAGGEAEKQIEALKKSAEAQITSEINFNRIGSKTVKELYDGDFWEDLTFACLSCGACTYVCPTCWCFDIQDETHGKDGQRLKIWDSCMFPLFTEHTTRHNPRGSKTHRTRQRFMHKLKYYQDKYDDGIMCVGCGRCIRACPVNIDIRKVSERINMRKGG